MPYAIADAYAALLMLHADYAILMPCHAATLYAIRCLFFFDVISRRYFRYCFRFRYSLFSLRFFADISFFFSLLRFFLFFAISMLMAPCCHVFFFVMLLIFSMRHADSVIIISALHAAATAP